MATKRRLPLRGLFPIAQEYATVEGGASTGSKSTAYSGAGCLQRVCCGLKATTAAHRLDQGWPQRKRTSKLRARSHGLRVACVRHGCPHACSHTAHSARKAIPAFHHQTLRSTRAGGSASRPNSRFTGMPYPYNSSCALVFICSTTLRDIVRILFGDCSHDASPRDVQPLQTSAGLPSLLTCIVQVEPVAMALLYFWGGCHGRIMRYQTPKRYGGSCERVANAEVEYAAIRGIPQCSAKLRERRQPHGKRRSSCYTVWTAS